MTGEGSTLDAGGMSEDRIPLLEELLDALPFSVILHGIGEGFPVRLRNRRDEERLNMLRPERAAARFPELRELAKQVVATRRGDHVEITVRGKDGQRFAWDWIMSPLLDRRGEVVGLVSVVEDLTRPVIAHRRMQDAVEQGMHLLLEIGQLAEERSTIAEFLSGVAERLGRVVKADRVAFNEFDPDRKVLLPVAGLVPSVEPVSPALDNRAAAARDPAAGEQAPVPDSSSFQGLPCDPDVSDLLSQVMFAGRVYRGTVDLTSFEFRPYAGIVDLSSEVGSKVIFVPWRAGAERMGVVAAQRTRELEDFTHEDGIVLMAAAHAAGLVLQRKRAELMLAERADELESLERAKSSFLRLASHELRGPLTLLQGYTSLLADPELPPERNREILPVMAQAVGRMNLLVTQLMDATRLQEGQFDLDRREADLRDLVRSAVENELPLWKGERGEDFELTLPETAVPVLVDVFRVETIVQNLLDNAFKYSEPGDRVRCALQVDPAGVRVVIQDEGIGITREEMADLFTRFGRVVNERTSHIRGSGLGLFISQEIAHLHGGKIVAASPGEKGSRFELVLPVTAEPEEQVVQ